MPFDGRTAAPFTHYGACAPGCSSARGTAGRAGCDQYGVTTLELFKALGLDLSGLHLRSVEEGFKRHGFALIHQPNVSRRRKPGRLSGRTRASSGGKRIAVDSSSGSTMLSAVSFIHQPKVAWDALRQAGETDLVTVKGLEGGTEHRTGLHRRR